MGTLSTINSAISDNTFYSVEVKGEGQDCIRYALTGTTASETVSDFNQELPEITDRIEWTCIGADDNVVDGVRNTEDRTNFTIEKISQSYVIQRADQPVFDLQFYVYVDNEVRVRLRPILMTSFAFVLGVMPLLFATGAGAQSRIALGAAVVFGMAMNTLLATIYIPNFYELMQKLQERFSKKKADDGSGKDAATQ